MVLDEILRYIDVLVRVYVRLVSEVSNKYYYWKEAVDSVTRPALLFVLE
jgi:hypothetical protein